MKSNFQKLEREKQLELLKNTDVFENEKGGGKFIGKNREFVLLDGDKNLYAHIRENAKAYFEENGISWWQGNKPNGHILSSQIACLNHLFPFRNDKDAVLKILNGVRNIFKEVLPVPCDKGLKGYIAFEVVSKEDRLNEGTPNRGALCTSIDAVIYAKTNEDKLILVPIEWKYTEFYDDQDKSKGGEEIKNGRRTGGKRRLQRYTDLINESKQLKSLDNYEGSIYYQEPFYQLMRQTLLAAEMVKNKDTELIKAEDFLHIHVIPSANKDLLNRKYKVTGKSMEASWDDCLFDKTKYVRVDPKDLLEPIKEDYPEVVEYLHKRYCRK